MCTGDLPTQSTTTTSDARNERIGLVDSVTNQTTVYDPDHVYLVKAIYLPTLADLTKEQQSLFGYDDRHRLVEVKHQVCTVSTGHSCSATSAIGETDYAYDDNDNRTQVVENNGAATTDRRYCYDAVDRLQYRNTAAACGSAAKDESYAYDDTGNRTQTVVGAVTTNFGYNATGQLCATGATTCTTPNVTYDTAGRTKVWNGWNFTYDAEARLVSACKSATCASGFDKVEFAYDGEGHRTQIKTTSAAGAVSTTDFRYQADAIVEEKLTDATHAGVVVRSYVVDDAGTVVKLVIPAGEADAGTYLPAWNGHGDALNLSRLNADGSLTLANSFSYSSWGAPATATHNSIGNLGFRFLYVGESDVQWDDAFGLGLTYMHARHYSPALGRFLQPDPDGLEDNQYAYVANNPVTETDPEGTCFIVCAIVNAVVDTAIYLATTDSSEWSVGGVVGAAATGAVTGFIGVGLLSKVTKIGKLAGAAGKVTRTLSGVTRSTAKFVPRVGQSSKIKRLVAEANRAFPKKAARPDEWHHIHPKYLGGPASGRQVRIPAAYHQRITNAFREAAPYGRARPAASQVKRIMNDVYRKYPISGFPQRGR